MTGDTPRIERRRFLSWLLGTSFGGFLATALYPVLRYLSPPDLPEATAAEVEAGAVNDPELLESGFKILRFGVEPVILIRVSDTDYRAFSATCTHLDCIVEYRKDRQAIWCNCHNGQYDLAGRNVAGPPPRPLTVFQVHRLARGGGQADTLVVQRV